MIEGRLNRLAWLNIHRYVNAEVEKVLSQFLSIPRRVNLSLKQWFLSFNNYIKNSNINNKCYRGTPNIKYIKLLFVINNYILSFYMHL